MHMFILRNMENPQVHLVQCKVNIKAMIKFNLIVYAAFLSISLALLHLKYIKG